MRLDMDKRKIDIEDKQLCYDEAKRKALAAADRASQAETAARVAREHAVKMAERQNAALRELNIAKETA